jgi:hypothetical protein
LFGGDVGHTIGENVLRFRRLPVFSLLGVLVITLVLFLVVAMTGRAILGQ